MQTVIARIFYYVNKSGNERMTLGELRKSNFMDVLALLDEEDDINKVGCTLALVCSLVVPLPHTQSRL